MLVQRGAALVGIDSAKIHDTKGLRPAHTVLWAARIPSWNASLAWVATEVQCPVCRRPRPYADWSSSQCGLSRPCPDGLFRPRWEQGCGPCGRFFMR